MFKRTSSNAKLAVVAVSSPVMDEDCMSVKSKSSLSSLASKISKPRLPSFRKSKSKPSVPSENSTPVVNHFSAHYYDEEAFMQRTAVDCSMVHEGDEEEQAPSFCVPETRIPARPVSGVLVPSHSQQQHNSPPKKTKVTQALEGSYLEDGRAEREATIEALKMQLAQALEELEEADRFRLSMGGTQSIILGLKTQMEMRDMELADSELARTKAMREASKIQQQLRADLDQAKQELEIAKKSRAKLMEIAAQEGGASFKASAAGGSFRRSDTELALRAQNQQLQNQVLRLESDVARLKTKLVENESAETASMKERRMQEEDEQFQRAVNAARKLFVEGTISKLEYDQIVQSAERVSLAYL
ncbi:hypothetical protein BASA81_008722 [Batrachochytrium salamandrivorans]|nr:hypothetical protein BASA81_008722 [Batrachochytrium salamandrivorans]